MKIGDIFTDGGFTYQVIGENEAGLISKRIEGEPEIKEEVAPKKRTRKTTESV